MTGPGSSYRDKSYIAFCTAGYRSAIASSILRRSGFKVSDVAGGFAAVSVYAPEHTTTGVVGNLEIVTFYWPRSQSPLCCSTLTNWDGTGNNLGCCFREIVHHHSGVDNFAEAISSSTVPWFSVNNLRLCLPFIPGHILCI